MTEKRKKTFFIIIMGIVIIAGFSITERNEKSLLKNKKLAIGKVTEISNGSQAGDWFIEFKYYVNGIIFSSSDPLSSGYPKFTRESKPIIGKFYYVEYDSLNPKNSKIIIKKESYFDYQLPELNGTEIKGLVENISMISENYLDLYISYKIYNEDFSFRSRFHKDSLPCGQKLSCLNSMVDLKVAKLYPELNDLFFKSYDRVAMRKKSLKGK